MNSIEHKYVYIDLFFLHQQGETVNDFSQCRVGRLAANETADESSNGTAVAFGASTVETAKNTFHDYSSAVNSEAEFGTSSHDSSC